MPLALPADRPAGLALLGLPTGTRLWRIDAHPPEEWSWDGFPEPRHRFDPADGSFRTRYASTRFYGAGRERYLDTGRYVPAGHADHHVVELAATRPFRVLDLRNEAKLDLLGLDDRISTSHEPAVWSAAHLLAERARRWWDRHRRHRLPRPHHAVVDVQHRVLVDRRLHRHRPPAARVHRGARRPRPPPRLHPRLRLGLSDAATG